VRCRFCHTELTQRFVDLVASPPSNAYLKAEDLGKPEVYFPLKLFVCGTCFLVQVDEYESRERLFSNDYAYFSSVSATWVAHCREYAEMAIRRFGLGRSSRVVEVASNDGCLLTFFQDAGIPSLGIEPTASTARAAREKGIETLQEFLTAESARRLAAEGRTAGLLVGNNVLAHVPDINDFVRGLATLLEPEGVITMEFPHLLRLIDECQFDTIYHEHFSYLSAIFVTRLFESHDLSVFDIEKLATHGGSLRIFAAHRGRQRETAAVADVLAEERRRGLALPSFFGGFQERVDGVKREFLDFLLQARREGRRVAGYGAAAKGNTLLNYCGVKPDLLDFVVDRSPHKQGLYLPGSHIPIVDEGHLIRERPGYIVILPWNLKEEIMEQLSYAREWGARFVTAIPRLRVL
jgi:hypothetical protein